MTETMTNDLPNSHDGGPSSSDPIDVVADSDVGSAAQAGRSTWTRSRAVRWLPFGLAAAALVALNVGMYTRLSGQAAAADVSATQPTASQVAKDVPLEAPDEPATEAVRATPVDVTAARETVAVVAGPGPAKGHYALGGGTFVATTPGAAPASDALRDPTPAGTDTVDITAPPSDTIFFDTFDGGTEAAWLPLDGTWSQVDGRLLQDQSSGFDLSLIHQEVVAYPLTWKATFQHQEGSGAGLLFNLSAPDSRSGGHMVRYMGAGDAIAWGYFDERGVFIGQGGEPVAAPGAAEHTLEVHSSGQAYDVILDGQTIAAGVPVEEPVSPSRVGLLTSESAVSFLEATLLGTDRAEPSRITSAIEIRAANGSWLSEDGVFTQTDTGFTDYVSGMELSAESFVVSADILLPSDDAEEQVVGAGLLFSMREPTDLALSYMVRFGSGGRELFWGRYGDDQVFRGEGGILLEPRVGEPRTLELSVDDNSLDITVDGQMIADGVAIERSAGWLGLVSFGGPVTFGNVDVRPTQ